MSVSVSRARLNLRSLRAVADIACRAVVLVAATFALQGAAQTAPDTPRAPSAPVTAAMAGARPVAATVASSSGETRLMRPSSLVMPVRPGEVIRSGDRVRTGDGGHLELRFADGAVIALRPNSELIIDEYRFDPGSERSFFTLVRGAVHAVSGAIGKRFRDDYRMQTPTVVVGIRGTEFELVEENGARVTVIQGRVALSNDAGVIEVPQGRTAVVRDRATLAAIVDAGTGAPAVDRGAAPPPRRRTGPAGGPGATAPTPGAGTGISPEEFGAAPAK